MKHMVLFDAIEHVTSLDLGGVTVSLQNHGVYYIYDNLLQS